jgi:hypothetical protein
MRLNGKRANTARDSRSWYQATFSEARDLFGRLGI